MAFIMLWAFFDKLLGLGYSTSSDMAWIRGVSPTYGFLNYALKESILGAIFGKLSGYYVVDILFMAGLLGVGTALLLGIAVRIAGYAGALQMFLIYLSLFPPENNPLVDEHIIYILVFLGLAQEPFRPGKLGEWWRKRELIKKYPILR